METRIASANALVLIAVCVAACAATEPRGGGESAAGPRQVFDPELIRQGGRLAQVGNCMSCHTTAGGRAFAGGLALRTPFGTLYSSNITPDPDTGIGDWSEVEFRRAMHEGIGRDGRHLYPAFPYDHFVQVTNDDVKALYAFLMTRDPVRAEVPPNQLRFPLNMRGVVAGWNLFFLRAGTYQPSPSKSTEWNRGAYLAEGLGHCGACHTPRNMFAAEERDAAYSGGEVEGWDAPPLNGSSMAPQGWSAEQLFNYLRRGGDEHHGVAAGPMKQVTHNLSQVAEADVRAIATYFAEEMAGATAPRAATDTAERQKLAAQAAPDGAAIFAGACAGCHDSDAPRVMAGRTSLAASTAVNAVSPRNTVQIVMHGVQPPEGERGAYMPGFATILTDAQVSDLVAYVRVRFSPQPAWRDLEPQVHDIRKGGDQE